jgi:hypothetical protein
MKSSKIILIFTLVAILLLSACNTSVKLGELKKIDEGGFSFKVVLGYTYEAQGAQVIMTAPNASTDTGPLYMLSAGDLPEGTTLDTMISSIIGSPTGAKTADVKIKGLACKTVEVTDSSTGTATFVKFLFCLPSSTRGFLMAGAAPKDQWDKEAGKYFDPIVSSLSFYDPIVTPTQQP